MTDTPALVVARLREAAAELHAANAEARAVAAEQEIDAWKAGRMADHTGHMFRCAKVNGAWNCQKGCAIVRAEAVEQNVSVLEEMVENSYQARRELQKSIDRLEARAETAEQEREADTARIESRDEDIQSWMAAHEKQRARAEAVEQALAQLRTAFAKLDNLCEEVRSSHRDKDSAEYNQCEDGECVWCQETKAALALAGL